MISGRRSAVSRRALRESRGVTLIELLVATAIAAVVLASAWAWLWNIAAVAARTDADAQARTAAVAAARAVARDVRRATAVARPSSGRDPSLTLELRHDRLDRAAEVVVIAWNPSRRVLWRNAPGTYLSDGVTVFSVAYETADGRVLGGREMQTADWGDVRLVSFALTVEVGGQSADCRTDVMVGPG